MFTFQKCANVAFQSLITMVTYERLRLVDPGEAPQRTESD
jgi:hypothetical protein